MLARLTNDISQINQAEAIRTGIEHWRRNRGRCMGSIYWQLNDNWPVNSWSSLDGAGRWKLLHYAVKRAYAPVVASAEALAPAGIERAPADSPRIALHLSNENPFALSATLSWSLVATDGTELDSGSAAVSLPAFASRAVAELDYASKLGYASGDRRVAPLRNALLFFRWTARPHGDQAATPAASGTADPEVAGREIVGPVSCHAFAPWKSVELERAAVTLSVGRDGAGRRTVTLRSDKPALFVTVSGRDFDAVLDDNGIPLDGRNERVLTVVRGGESLDDREFAAGLRVSHLRESY